MSMYDNNSKDDVYYYMEQFLEEGYSVAELIDILADVVRYHQDTDGDEEWADAKTSITSAGICIMKE